MENNGDKDSSVNRKPPKKKKLESLVRKAKHRKLESQPPTTDGNTLISDDGYSTASPSDQTTTPIGFTVISKQSGDKIGKVQHYLPDWLRQPVIISADLKSCDFPVENLKCVDDVLIQNIKNEGITHLFPVQAEVIPWVLKDVKRFGLSCPNPLRSRDVCVSVPTGSGKTLAYVVPIIQALSRRVVPKIRALVVAPVQELVVQITNVFKSLSKGTQLKVVACVGGRTPLAIEQDKLVRQINENDYESLADILVVTPGRLVEHLENTQGFHLHALRFLVMDEADRMFENIQNEWLYHLDKHLSSRVKNDGSLSSGKVQKLCRQLYPQRLLFSATLSQDPEKLKKLNLFQPKLFSTVVSLESSKHADITEDYIGSFTTPENIKENFTIVEALMKPLVVCELVKRGWRGILCFINSALDAHKLSKLLSILIPDLKIQEISSLLSTERREEILNSFASGTVDMLISSDVMARGMDIHQVHYVISYDPPKHIKSYIHRVGRTGRAGSQGTALTILTPPQAPVFNQMLHDVNKDDVKEMALDPASLSRWKPEYKAALQKLKLLLQKEEHCPEDLAEKLNKTSLTRKSKNWAKKKRKKVKKSS